MSEHTFCKQCGQGILDLSEAFGNRSFCSLSCEWAYWDERVDD